MKRDFIVAFAGLQEATVAVADRVHRRVQEVKTSVDASLLEKQIEIDHALLGEKVYRKGQSDLGLLSKDPELYQLFDRIQQQQKKLTEMENITLPDESLIEFERIFLQSDFLIHHVVVLEKFSGVGKQIRELTLPPEMRVIFVRKRNRFKIGPSAKNYQGHLSRADLLGDPKGVVKVSPGAQDHGAPLGGGNVNHGVPLEMANGNTPIEAYDEVTFLCSKENLRPSIDYWEGH